MNTAPRTYFVTVEYKLEGDQLKVDGELVGGIGGRVRDEAYQAASYQLDNLKDFYENKGFELVRVIATTGGRTDRCGNFIEGSDTRFEFYPAAFGSGPNGVEEISSGPDAAETIGDWPKRRELRGDDEMSEAMMLHGDEATS